MTLAVLGQVAVEQIGVFTFGDCADRTYEQKMSHRFYRRNVL